MLTEKIKPEELEFMEMWHTPHCLAESLFSDFDNLGDFDEEKLGNIRLYQMTFLSSEAIIDEKMPGLDIKQQFQLKKGAGDIYNLGARKYGKSLITLKLDMALSSLYDDRMWCGFYSIDEKRLRGVLDSVKHAMEYHPIFKAWKFKCGYKPEIKFYSKKNKWKLQGINLRIKGKAPGDQFYSLHVEKLWGDEVSFETQSIYEKRKEALAEPGAVMRLAGMTNFTRHSPIGKTFYNPADKTKIVNLPQYVNPFAWDEKEEEDRIKTYGGRDSINYRVFVKGEIVEDGITELDMERISKCYSKKKNIKAFEITKDRFDRFRNFIVVERPKNAERIFIDADVGDKVTEIIVHSEIGNKYNYLYNIALHNLILDQQEEIFKFLIEKLEANVIGIDCGDAFGRVLSDHLEKAYSKDNIVRYAGASKLVIGFELDEKGNVILKNGKPVEKKEYMSEWSVARVKHLLYEQRCSIPVDYKSDMAFSYVMAIRSGTRVTYKCVCENPHIFDAWRVWAIAQWIKKDFNQTPRIKANWGIGIVDKV